MPRTSREISGTGIYHLKLRGINKQDLFDDEDDFLHFIQILHSLVDRHDEQGACLPPYCTIYAYCLMSNHVHLLIREKEGAISETVKRVGVAYARFGVAQPYYIIILALFLVLHLWMVWKMKETKDV